MKFKKIFAYILIAILCVNECFLTAQQTVFAEEKEESIATSTDAIEDISDASEDISEAQEDIENEEINAEENAGTFGVDNLEFDTENIVAYDLLTNVKENAASHNNSPPCF